MPTGRTRNRDARTGHTGTYYRIGVGTVSRTAMNGDIERCVDVIGNFPNDNPFEKVTQTVVRPTLSGVQISAGSGAIQRQLDAYPIDYVPNPADPRTWFASPDLATVNNLGWELLARTNISTPHISVPTFIAEMRDIPDLIKDWGGNLLRKIAKGHLTWRWAIKPMIGELWSMINFRNALSERMVMFSLMQKQRTARRRAGLGGDSHDTAPQSVILSSGQGAIIDAQRYRQIRQKIWGVVQWKLDDSVQFPDQRVPVEFERLVRRILLGMHSRELLYTAWEVTPWSWFIDYFAGIGTMIRATNNTVKCSYSRNVVMVHTYSVSRFTNVTGIPSWMSMSGLPVETFERKERFIAKPFLPYIPSFQPLLTARAVSILASLQTLKSHRGTYRGRRVRTFGE